MNSNQLVTDIQTLREQSRQHHALPIGLSAISHAEHIAGNTWKNMVEKDLIAGHIVIDSYREMIAYLGDQDPTTSQMLREILATEEKQADELVQLLHADLTMVLN